MTTDNRKIKAKGLVMKKCDEGQTPAFASKAVLHKEFWAQFLMSLTAEQREKVEELPPEDKPLVLHNWIISTTGSAGGLGEFLEWLDRLVVRKVSSATASLS